MDRRNQISEAPEEVQQHGAAHDPPRGHAATAARGRRRRGRGGAAVWLSEHSFRPVPAQAEQARRDHRVARPMPQLPATHRQCQGGEPRALVQQALANLGGISRFISRQDVVVIKPNIAWDRTPEQAANTNPEVVAEVVRQCWQAGAKRVIVTDVVATNRTAASSAPAFRPRRAPRAPKSSCPILSYSAKWTWAAWC